MSAERVNYTDAATGDEWELCCYTELPESGAALIRVCRVRPAAYPVWLLGPPPPADWREPEQLARLVREARHEDG